jgi:hypothetical protein
VARKPPGTYEGMAMTPIWVILGMIACCVLYILVRARHELKSFALAIPGGLAQTAKFMYLAMTAWKFWLKLLAWVAGVWVVIAALMIFGFVGPFLVALGALIFWAELTVPNAR